MSKNSEALHTIADELGQLYKQRAEEEILRLTTQGNLDARVDTLTPPEGWPGKNEEQRRAARTAALESDPMVTAYRDELDAVQTRSIRIRADTEILEAKRRAVEWEIRERLAERLGGRNDDLPF